MSQRAYEEYGGNPHAPQGGNTYTASSNPYGSGDVYGAPTDTYGRGGGHNAQHTAPPALHQQDSNYSQESSGQMTNVPHTDVPLQQAYQQQAYQAPPPAQHGSKTLTIPDFLSRVDGTKERIGQLTADIQSISTIHQRMLSSPDNSSSSELENIVTQTQIRNTQIKDEIQFLERDLSRPGQENAALKKTQINTVKNLFKTNLEAFQKEEHDYGERYRDAIARQYRIINPDATAAEVQEAANADWGNEGVFTQALKSNRSGQASSVLGAVRARHNDIQRIEKTMSELALLFTQLNEQVVYQEPQVAQIEEQTTQVHKDAEQANVHLDKGITSAKRARKLKWYTLLVVFLIIAILALALGIYFGVTNKPSK